MTSVNLNVKEDVTFGLLLHSYLKYKDTKKVALRKKRLGKWQGYSWEDYYRNVVWVGSGLLKLGLEHGDKVTILGDNDPEWLFAELGTLSIGGVGIGLYVDSIAPEVKHILNHSESKFVFAKDQEAVDKVLSIANEVPTLKKVIYWDPKGLWFYDNPLLINLEELIRIGQEAEKEKPELFKQAAERVQPDDMCILNYTSGTTGQPKGAMYTYHTALERSTILLLHMEEIESYYDEIFYISPAWVAGQLSIERHLAIGHTLNFPEGPETVQANIREIAPQTIFYPSRLWEDIISSVNREINDSGAVNRFMYKRALKVGYRIADCHFNKVKPSLSWRMAYALSYVLIFKPLKDRLGLTRVTGALTSGGSLGPDSFRFISALGLNLKQAYGLSEAAAIAYHRDGNVKFESVGTKATDELAITDEGEIVVKGRGLFVDYYKDTELTKQVMKDGWLHTGDAGYIDEDEHLFFWDRMSDLKYLRDGTRFSPLYIESRLRFSPYIKDPICVGGDKEYITVMVAIDFNNIGKWAERHRIPYTTFVDLSQRPEVLELIKNELQTVNATLPDWSAIKKLVNLPKELDPDEAELTRTRKLRRKLIEDRYSEIIEAIYAGKEEVSAEVQVKYRDGTERLLHAELKITDV